MKLRRKFAAVMAAMMLATALPVFAASTNGVNKIITVAKDTSLTAQLAPQLKIELKDDLAADQAFYLSLENAEWDEDILAELAEDENFTYTFSSDITELEVRAKNKLKASSKVYTIPMLTKVTGGEASVIIDSNDTVVTGGKYVYAVSNNEEASIKVTDAKSFATVGTMAEIAIEEAHIGSFNDEKKAQTVRFELEGSDFEFDYKEGKDLADKLVGSKAYTGKKFSVKVIDQTTLEATIEANALKATQRGVLTLKDIDVKANRNAPFGDVNVTVSGDFNDTTQVLVAKHGDYGTELTVAKEYTVTAGQQLKNIEFTLAETVADSLIGNRETTFTFPEGITIDQVAVKETEGITSGKVPVPVIEAKDKKNTNEFTVKSIAAANKKKASVTFEATLNVPASFTKDIDLIVEGRSLEDTKEATVATVTIPAIVEVAPVTLQGGLSKQSGGKVTIKETEKGKLSSGKIFLAIEDTDFNYTKAPEVKVTEGNLKVDTEAKVIRGGIEITVDRKSTKASTLEISGGEIRVERFAAEGSYPVQIGGTALSVHSSNQLWNADQKQYNDIDELVEKDFIYIGTKNKAQAVFVIGETAYTVNSEERTMDTAAYLAKEGRTMLPVRYVADALGVQPHEILWDGANKTVTILADRVIQIKLGEKEMLINGARVPMSAAAEIKNDRVFLPVAEVARALNANVAWDEITKTATFN